MSRFPDHFLDDVRARLPISAVIGPRVQWDRRKTVASRGDYWACCPFHGEKSPSFHCEDKKGRYHCFGCGASGDHFRFLTELDGMEFPRAVEQCASLAGLAMPNRGPETDLERREREKRGRERDRDREQREAADQRKRDERIKSAGAIWRETVPLENSSGAEYFKYRGLPVPVDDNLRFHSKLVHDVGNPALNVPGEHPAVVCRVQGPDGKGIGIWRIYLAAGGQGKLQVPEKSSAKVGKGPTAGGAVRMFGFGKHIGLCEGVETGVAVRALGWRLPIWPATSTSGIIGFVIPEGVEKVTVFPDPDGSKLRTKKKHNGETFISQPPGLEAYRNFVERNPWCDIGQAAGAFDDDYLTVWQRTNGLPIR